jgi:Cys-tRNA synthase (O-phospho-L-seryl-tRNA:Cys-tRNA synthase)
MIFLWGAAHDTKTQTSSSLMIFIESVFRVANVSEIKKINSTNCTAVYV